MATSELPLQKIRNLGVYGLIRESEVDNELIPDGALTEAVNVSFDRKGAVTLRPGLTAIGSQVLSGTTCFGLYNAMFSDSSLNCLLSVFGGTVWKSTGSDFTESTSNTGSLKTRFATFADRAIKVNGTDNMTCFTGTSWTTSGDPVNEDDMASYDTKYIDVFKSRVYTAGNSTNPDRLFYSSVVDGTGNIEWAPTEDYVDINPNDGENISAIRRFSLELLVFKPNYIYRFRTTAVDPDPLIKIGTRSQESVVEGKRGLYFHHDTGFFRYTGGYPQEISRPISDFIDAIALSAYSDIAGWRDNDHIYWSIGDLTVSGTSYTNVVVRYTESSQVWTVYSYGSELKIGVDYDDSSTLYRVVGDDNGYVLKVNEGTDDNGTAISYRGVTKWYSFGGVGDRKIIQEIISISEKAQAMKAEYQIDDESIWHNLGQVKEFKTDFGTLDIKFYRIRFKVSGISSQEAFIFRGFEMPKMLTEGVVELWPTK